MPMGSPMRAFFSRRSKAGLRITGGARLVCRLPGLVALLGCLIPMLATASGPPPVKQKSTDQVHLELLGAGHFPSASECRNCHVNHYDEWSGSQHAYAQLSPIFNAMNGELIKRTNGTVGVGVRFQHAIGRRAMSRIDGYGGRTKGTHGFVGGRSEPVIKF
jgi:hypothetical protein